jgi:hypothetical protein
MKILIVGDWHSQLHEEALYQALRQLGSEVLRFPWYVYFRPVRLLGRMVLPAFKFQNKYILGPLVSRLNRDLVASAWREQPDAVFVYRGTHIFRETLRHLRQVSPASTLVGYNNDDPFSPLYPQWMWRHFVTGLPEYDLILAYRHRNLDDFRRAGARRVRLFRSWYVPERNKSVLLSEEERCRFSCDVVFVGHYEKDYRLHCLEEIVRHGWKLNLFGHEYGWHPALKKSPLLRGFVPLRAVWDEDYNKALCGAKIGLCFLSKLNRDTYSRRCFEIPATGTLMLAEYTDDLAELFKEGEEADFFRSPGELMEKVDFYLRNEDIRRRVGQAGRRRLVTDGHDVVSRARELLLWIEELKACVGRCAEIF